MKKILIGSILTLVTGVGFAAGLDTQPGQNIDLSQLAPNAKSPVTTSTWQAGKEDSLKFSVTLPSQYQKTPIKKATINLDCTFTPIKSDTLEMLLGRKDSSGSSIDAHQKLHVVKPLKFHNDDGNSKSDVIVYLNHNYISPFKTHFDAGDKISCTASYSNPSS